MYNSAREKDDEFETLDVLTVLSRAASSRIDRLTDRRSRGSNAFYRHIDLTRLESAARRHEGTSVIVPQLRRIYVPLKIRATLRVRPFDPHPRPPRGARISRASTRVPLRQVRDRRHTMVNCFCGFTLRGGARGEKGGNESRGAETSLSPSSSIRWVNGTMGDGEG